MCIDNCIHDGEPESAAARAPGARRVGAPEGLEGTCIGAGRKSWPSVADTQQSNVTGDSGFNRDKFA
jgi:hypothetical protein